MMRAPAFTLWLLGLGIGVPGCHRPAAPASAAMRVITDGIGREVRWPKELHRIISLAPSSTEIVFALGAGAQLVGVDRYSDYPEAARRIERVGAEVDPSLERILGLHPDAVFTATSANAQQTVETLARLGVPVYVSRAASLADILGDVNGMAGALDRRIEGARLIAQLEHRLAAVKARAETQRAMKVLVVVWPEPLVVAGRASHVADLVRAAGGVNVADDSAQPFPTYSVERVLSHAPELVVVGTHSDGPAPTLQPLLALTTLPAVRNGQFHTVDGDLLFRPGPRVVDGIERLAKLIDGARR